MNSVVGIGIPSTLKLSIATKQFEEFGDVVKASIDSKRRQKFDKINIFIQYADSISAKRALKTGYIILDGERINIEEENKPKRNLEDKYEQETSNKRGRFEIESKITKITSRNLREKNKEQADKHHHRETKNKDETTANKKYPALMSFIRQDAKRRNY